MILPRCASMSPPVKGHKKVKFCGMKSRWTDLVLNSERAVFSDDYSADSMTHCAILSKNSSKSAFSIFNPAISHTASIYYRSSSYLESSFM
ncbi:hypothetical protein CC80DRAFT_255829 [Byssothecium circinans]|uniref:Uncharacterized protein n=1 Tax=Byssothecium circinans TaxID=147558 RepID=A0A6A5TBC3_9PLEO|nr:hypothetical protein CC80DRAFT_255829 [Byssothecium circinans]